MKQIILVLFLILIFQAGFAQTGILRGKITDSETGEELPGASVLITGSYNGASADLDGNYTINNCPLGKIQIKCSYISYQTQIINDLQIVSGKVTVLNIKLHPVSVGLGEVVVSAKAVRNTESALLTMQQKSAGVIEGISSQEIMKTGDSDAAGAVKRLPGVSVEEGKYVFVRGLGDRYSKTTLNGAEIPSLDPERNTVQMDIFPTSAIENMVVYKSFTPDLSSFTGGLINIRTKDFPEKLNIKFSVSLGFNSQSSLNGNFLSYRGGRYDQLGFDDGTRAFPIKPEDIPSYPGDRDKLDQITMMFNKIMGPDTIKSFLNQKYEFSAGNQTTLLGKQFGFNIGLVYKNDLHYFNDGKRGIYKLTGANAGQLNEEQNFNETKSNNEVLLGCLANFNLKINSNNKIGYVLLYNHSGNKSAIYNEGERASDEIGMIIQSSEIGFVERSILASQFKGDHFFENFNNLKISWIISYTTSMQEEPDLRFFTNSYFPDNDPGFQYELSPSKYKVPSRYYRTMYETNLDNKINFELPFTFLGSKSKLKFGGSYNYKQRDFNEGKIDYKSQVSYFNGNINDYFADENIGQHFPSYNPQTKSNYGLYVQNATDLRNSYTGFQNVTGAYAMVDIPVAEKLRMVAGVRYEKNKMLTQSKKQGIDKGELNDNDFLPALNLTYYLKEKMNLRFSYTRTLSRPTFREIAPFASFSPVAPTIVGNPDLKRTLIDNLDIKWEYFMRPGEVLSAGAFFKNFTNPIEMVDNPVAANPEISYQNVKQAKVYGLELDLSKSLDFIPLLKYFSLSANYSYIFSEVAIDSMELEAIHAVDPDHPDKRPLFGQAPYIVNGMLSYQNQKTGVSANLVFNMVGKRIALVTKGGTPEVYEQPSPKLNFNATKKMGKHLALGIKINNILNAPVKQTYSYKGRQYPYYEYTTGRLFEIKFTYDF